MSMDLVIEVDERAGGAGRGRQGDQRRRREHRRGDLPRYRRRPAELHILVPHAAAAKHVLAISHLAVTREREVAVVEVDDRPGVLADLAGKVAAAGINLDLVYVATGNRVVFGAEDLDGLRAVLGT